MSDPKKVWPLVSIISVSYDHPEVTCQMLESLRHISYPSIEVIVVDNCSPNDSPDIIKEKYPEVKLVKLSVNLGFAGANNIGMKMAGGEYVMLLNNDTEVTEGFLEPLVQKLMDNPEIGAVSPKIRLFYQPDTLQFTTISVMNPYTARTTAYGYGVKDEGQFEADSPTAFGHGAAFMVPMSLIREVGLMPDIYFLYYEELDWCERFKEKGKQIWYVHNSMIYHKESISTGKFSPVKTYYLNRARILFTRRNVKSPTLYFSLLYQFVIALPKNAIVFVLKGDFKLFRAYLRAVIWNVSTFFNPRIHATPAYSSIDEHEKRVIITIQ